MEWKGGVKMHMTTATMIKEIYRFNQFISEIYEFEHVYV